MEFGNVNMPSHIKDLDNAQAGGAYLSQLQPQPPISLYGDTGVQLTDKQKDVSVFC